jgi:hypothetical protein
MDYRGHAPALTRLSSMGQVLAGWQATLDGGLNEPGEATAIAPDLAGGVALGVGGLGKGSGPSLVDFGPDLSPRADFSDSSRVRVDSLARLSDGRLVALEESPPHYRRLLPDGAADPTFPPALPTLGSILSVDDEDRMVIGGNASVSRLLVDGALDDTFGDPVVLGAAAPRTGTTLFWAPQDNAEAGLLPLDLISFVSPASSGILLVAQRGSDWVLVRLCA